MSAHARQPRGQRRDRRGAAGVLDRRRRHRELEHAGQPLAVQPRLRGGARAGRAGRRPDRLGRADPGHHRRRPQRAQPGRAPALRGRTWRRRSATGWGLPAVPRGRGAVRGAALPGPAGGGAGRAGHGRRRRGRAVGRRRRTRCGSPARSAPALSSRPRRAPWTARRAVAVLATVLFTDIVGSTSLAARLGDQGWAELLERHNGSCDASWPGPVAARSTPPATASSPAFTTPAQAIRCAASIRDALCRRRDHRPRPACTPVRPASPATS